MTSVMLSYHLCEYAKAKILLVFIKFRFLHLFILICFIIYFLLLARYVPNIA